MAAWIEDAQVLTKERDLSRSQKSLLKRTTDVDHFLSERHLTSTALVAPKGFGKTFVLKLKRISLQDQDYHCIPHGRIVDRPRDRPPILPNDILDLLARSEHWETLWQIAFTISLLKGYKSDTEAHAFLDDIRRHSKGNPRLETILAEAHIDTPFEIVHCCLSASRGEFYDIIDKSQFITAAYSRFNRQCAIFIDNIDEYLESYINIDRSRRDDTHTLYLRLWHNGQIGAWRAIRRLHGVNPHIRIYMSLRKEAYHFASDFDPSFSNLKAFSIELRYSKSDIREIIEKNITNEPRLVDKNANVPIVRFLGKANEQISNSGTGKSESALDYWLRHCTGRPRDAMEIGGEISKISAEERSISSVRSAINSAASQRVQTLFREVAPFFEGFFPDLLPKIIRTNVLTRDQVKAAAAKYSELACEKYGQSAQSTAHPFCALYAIGLIGIVTEDRDRFGSLIQRFSSVGQVPFGTVGVLPYAKTYLIHPSLSDFIINKDATFLSNLNRQNIVGDGLEWRSEEEIRFVALGDMRGFRSKIMGSVGGSQTFDRFWTSVFAQHTNGLDFAQTSGGDSLVIADRSPIRLIRSIKSLATSLRKSGYNLQMRVGAHSGHWRLNLDDDGGAHPEMSDIVGIAARLEPLGKAGAMIFTDKFLDDARRMGSSIDTEIFRPLRKDDTSNPEAFDDDKGLLISKKKEPEQWFSCFIIENIDDPNEGATSRLL